MAERRSKCPKCFALDPDVVKIHNPETCDMNANVTLKCWDCLHTWEGKTTSPKHEEDKEKGWIM
jgi:hypothetical protein